jgi:pimeloyl-ACP methyl ester carboxylesterase
MRSLAIALILTAVCAAAPKTEIGEINGAKFRVDVPENWNGELVMYCHGYSPVAVSYDSTPNPIVNGFVAQGFAVAQSGYAAGGWAIAEAVQDTEALRRYVAGKYGKPKRTYVMGHSMGGFLTMLMMESFPTVYDGGLALCGPLAPATFFMGRHVFDLAVVFDYYFPGALPSPAKVPPDYAGGEAKNKEIEKLLDGKPESAAAMRRYAGVRSNKDLAGTVVFFRYILKDLQERGGGNPFDNRGVAYWGTEDVNALNDGVARYSADPNAAAYLERYYSPSGKLARPMLAIHTTYDPLVPPWVPNLYATISQHGGSDRLFVQQYVKRGGHCAITPEETGRGFRQLRQWGLDGKRPEAGLSRP